MAAQMSMANLQHPNLRRTCRFYKAHCLNKHGRPYNNPLAFGEGVITVLMDYHSLAIGPTLGFSVAVSYSKRPNSMPSLPQ